MTEYDGRMEYERRRMEERRENNRCGWCGTYVDEGNGQCAEQGPPCDPHMQNIHEKEMEQRQHEEWERDYYKRQPHEGEG